LEIGTRGEKRKADIQVKDNKGKSLLIIECKTWGKEFENAWKDTLEDGAQLFSYYQQDKDTQFVALYASQFADDKINYAYKLISTKDNTEYLKSNKRLKGFKDATTNKELFKVWAETYQKDYSEVGLFEDDIAAYDIGKNKYSTADLKEIDADKIQKKYHEFATILRQHNVSGHENAFDKLVNLFLAKVVDEKNNAKELKFYWKGVAYDDMYSLIDRLQFLYKTGMEKFLGETVTYVSEDDIKKSFKLFKNDPDATRDSIIKFFRELKYYSDNDFAFINVHNEKLFEQNAEVLLKIVKMLQDIKLQTETQNQFLGDLFEGFLDKGVKQSEGQFFTPTPIVKFLISSLPLAKKIKEKTEPLKTIDYACGAGHFLNEYAAQILPILTETKRDKKDYYANIFGIEKEYRLSKVAKVSAFMYGQDDIKIIYDDALKAHKDIKDGAFDILVANPPYSVKGFMETLGENDLKKFDLSNFVDDKQKKSNNSIETFFIERAKQLLTSGGIAAIILPSSVLSNDSLYIKAREIILKYFDLIAIAEFGSGTFGKTGTNTATLFLRRKDTNPDIAEHYKNRVESWFNGNDADKEKVFNDSHIIEAYCEHCGFDYEEYKTLLKGNPSDKILQNEIFNEYKKEFDKKRNEKDFAKFCKEIEKEKIYYFALAKDVKNPVVIVRSPADNKAIKDFLGYEWSNRKGNEGIKYIGVAAPTDEENEIIRNKGISQIKTPLFNPNNLTDGDKINSLIRANFENNSVIIPDNLKPFVSLARLTDMLDFSRVSFDKQIKTTPDKKIEIVSKYELKRLGDMFQVETGKRDANEANNNGQYPFFTCAKSPLQINSFVWDDEAIIIAGNGEFHTQYFNGKFDAYQRTYVVTNKTKNDIQTLFAFYVLDNRFKEYALSVKRGNTQPYIVLANVTDFKIPVPPLDIQKKIVEECQKIDQEYETSRMTIKEKKQKIADLLERESSNKNNRKVKIGEVLHYSDNRVDFTTLTPQNYVGVDNLLQDTQGKTNSNFVLTSGTAIEYKIGDILLSNIRPYLKKIWFADNNGGSSNDVLVLQTKNNEIDPKFAFYNLKQDKFFDYEMAVVKGMKMPRGDKKHIMNYQIPLPPLSRQQEIVAEIEKIEAEIAAAEQIMNAMAEKKSAALKKYL
jgi:type I restriction-modification system DNA methylase subunit